MDINIVELENDDIKILVDGSIVSWAEIYGDPTRCRALMKLLQELLKNKVDVNEPIEGNTKCKITYDEKGLVISGEDLTIEDLPELILENITDIIATADEVNILHGLLLTTDELNSLKGLVNGFNPDILLLLNGLTGNIQEQLDSKQNKLKYTAEDVANKTNSHTLQSQTTYPTSKALYQGLLNKQNSLSTKQLDAVNSGITEAIVTEYNKSLNIINTVVPVEASKDNKLADKQFVKDWVYDHAGYYVTKDVNNTPFDSYQELSTTPIFYHNGEVKRINDNDYALVLCDETKGNSKVMYNWIKDKIYNEGHWVFKYQIVEDSNKYALKSETYTKEEVNNLISALKQRIQALEDNI